MKKVEIVYNAGPLGTSGTVTLEGEEIDIEEDETRVVVAALVNGEPADEFHVHTSRFITARVTDTEEATA